jgi:hypothetical protein
MPQELKLNPSRLSDILLLTIFGTLLFFNMLPGLAGPSSTGAQDTIVEGIGWRDVRVGMAKEDLLRALGMPDGDSKPNWLKWSRLYIDCLLQKDSSTVAEVRFNPGFYGALANGLGIGSPANKLRDYYSEKPLITIDRDSGATKYVFAAKGVLFWTQKGLITQVVVFQQQTGRAPAVKKTGGGDIGLGMSMEDLVNALGQPDSDSTSNWLKWSTLHIDCTFHTGATGVSEIRLNPGFEGELPNGLKVGSPADQAIQLFGDKPDFITRRDNGATKYEYSTKGVLFWTHEGKITQLVFFEPYHPK